MMTTKQMMWQVRHHYYAGHTMTYDHTKNTLLFEWDRWCRLTVPLDKFFDLEQQNYIFDLIMPRLK